MFIKVGSVNYFVITDNKSPIDIFNEIFARMQEQKLSIQEKRKILSEIKKQIN